MGSKIQYAIWRRLGRLYIAKPPDWPRNVEFSCTEKSDLIEWARNHGYMLKDGNPVREPRQPRRDWQ